jgi:hypothetical protein
MSKVKNITRRVTQEVRTIDTSLINKEEVFKMLALAESTGSLGTGSKTGPGRT